ncbi:MAG: histidine--tRNA ligase [Omnitrophica bacterium RBG_13_46_9]|nr:MAG: histidine--tRNA ligase [Omnitrophica bacterium RBG_13_46_9]
MKYTAIRGMEDIFSPDIHIWRHLEETARKYLDSYLYSEIRTPIIESTSVFTRSIGETTDIVTKEMYTFLDKKGRSLTLRPEGTAPIVRAYIEHAMDKLAGEVKLYYIGPMFRSERPQKGRSRQFHQIGVEVFGSGSPYADAQLIMQMSQMLKCFGLKGFTVKLNSLGCENEKQTFSEKLKGYLKTHKARLCQDCKDRIERNPLRSLDCKSDACIQVMRDAPGISDSLCPPCRDHFERLKERLSAMRVDYTETKNLVRGLDYYTGTVFEVTHPALGAQDAIGAGGRYDNLVKDLGGPDVKAVGYALGMERIILALKEVPLELKTLTVIFIATLGDWAKIEGIQLAEKIRREFLDRVAVLTDIKEASLKSQLGNADKSNAKIVIILGENELEKKQAIIRDMATKEQEIVAMADISEEIKRRLG